MADAIRPLEYDLMIFDYPPGVEYLERLGLVAANSTLVCTDAHPLAVMGAGRVLSELGLRKQKGRRGSQRWAIALSRIDLRRSMDQALDKQLADAYPDVPRLMVHQDASLAWAGAERIPLMDYEASCRGGKDLKK